MSTDNSKWETLVTMTTKEYFTTPFLNPHEGFVRLVREIEKEIGKEKAHKMVAKVRDDCARDFAAKMGGGKLQLGRILTMNRVYAHIHSWICR